MKCLVLHHKPTAEVHPGHMLTGPKEEEEESLLDLFATGCRLLGVLFITSPKSSFCAALTTQNTTENCVTVHPQNTTALEPNVL
jgi:hypothetical protein